MALTDKETETHFNIATFRLKQPRGRLSENTLSVDYFVRFDSGCGEYMEINMFSEEMK